MRSALATVAVVMLALGLVVTTGCRNSDDTATTKQSTADTAEVGGDDTDGGDVRGGSGTGDDGGDSSGSGDDAGGDTSGDGTAGDGGTGGDDGGGSGGGPAECEETADCDDLCPPDAPGCACFNNRCLPTCESDDDCRATPDGHETYCHPEHLVCLLVE